MKKALFLLLAFASMLWAQDAGRLQRFEEGRSRDRAPREPRERRTASDLEDTSFEEAFLEFVAELLFGTLYYGLDSGGRQAAAYSDFRQPGDPLFPMLRLDVGTQYISSDVQAFGYGFEVGQGILAADFRHSYYRDRLFDDTLHQFQYLALYRMSAHRRTQIDLAVGAMTLHGEDTRTAFSMGLPVRYWPSRNLGVEVRPVWGFFSGGTLMDVDTGLLFRFEHSSLRLGYRWVERGDESLSGPRIGLSFRF